jgi:type II secretory pathway component GspD/PulD (secretin)
LVAALLLPPLTECLPHGGIKTCIRPSCLSSDESELIRRLELPVALRFQDTPLSQVIDDIASLTNVNIVLDVADLKEHDISLRQPVTFTVENVAVKTALNMMLRQAHLTSVIRDGVVQVTTPVVARGPLVQKAYPVADLLTKEFPRVNGELQPARRTREDAIINLIISTVAPNSWVDAGGSGTVQYYPLGHCVVVNQSQDIQEQVADLLDALRRMDDPQTAVEMRIVRTTPEMLERMKTDLNLRNVAAAKSKSLPTYFLTDAQVRQMLEMAQGDRTTNIMMSPKMTLANGQHGVVEIIENYRYPEAVCTIPEMTGKRNVRHIRTTHLGQRLALRPVVSADGRYVHLSVDWRLTEKGPSSCHLRTSELRLTSGGTESSMDLVEEPSFNKLKVKQKAAVRDGHTVMWYAGTLPTETRTEYGPPVLSEIPYVGRLFSTVGYSTETQAVLVLVTPRILVDADEQPGNGQATPVPIPRP